MKYLLLSLVLIGCTHKSVFVDKWKVGDCVVYNYKYIEHWEAPAKIERIEEIGNFSYRTSFYFKNGNSYTNSTLGIYFSDSDNYSKVECPK